MEEKRKGLDPKKTEEILKNPDTWEFSGYLETTPEDEERMKPFLDKMRAEIDKRLNEK